MKKVLFVAYGGGHITMVAPVVRELERAGVQCQVLALTTGGHKARQLGLQPLGYRDFEALVPDRERVLQWGGELADLNAHPDVDRHESLLYLGVNFAQWVRDHGEQRARAIYQERGRRGFYPLDFMRAVVAHVEPDVVVTTNSPRSEQAAVEAAGALAVPSLTMVDLFVQPSDPFCRRKHHADRIAVLSTSVKAALQVAGIAADRIAVTGNPAFDTLRSDQVLAQAREFRQRLGWDGQRVTLYAGNVEDEAGTPPQWQGMGFALEVQSRLQRRVEQHEDCALLLRYHPSESHLFPPPGAHPRIYRSEPSREALHPVLLASDVVVVQNSTVGLEAALSGRRVLCLDFAPSVHHTSFNYVDLGLAEGVGSFDALQDALGTAGGSVRVDPADYSVGHAARNVAAEVMDVQRWRR